MQLTFSLYSLAGLLFMLGVGLIGLGIYQRWIHPANFRRHEKAKVTGTQGRDPAFLKMIIKIFSLVIMPAIGFVFGDPTLSNLFGQG